MFSNCPDAAETARARALTYFGFIYALLSARTIKLFRIIATRLIVMIVLRHSG